MGRRDKGVVHSVTLPPVLAEQVDDKMKIIGYSSVGEVCRDLLRRWIADDI